MPKYRVSLKILFTLYIICLILICAPVVQINARNVDFTSPFGSGDLSIGGNYASGILDGQMLYTEAMGEGYNELTIVPKTFNATLTVDLNISNGEYNGFVFLDMPPNNPTSSVRMNITGDSSNLYINTKFDVIYGKYPINNPQYGLETWTIDKNLMFWFERDMTKTLPASASTQGSLLYKTYGIMRVLGGTTSRENILVGGIIVGERETITGHIGGGVNWLILNPLCLLFGGHFQKPTAESVWKIKALETTLQNVQDGELHLSYSPKLGEVNLKINGKIGLEKIMQTMTNPILLPSEWDITKMGLTPTINPVDLKVESSLVTALNETMNPPAPLLTVVPSALGNSYSGGTTKINVSVKNEATPISGATIALTSDKGGTFSVVKDLGNSTYSATFTAPTVTQITLCTITASASKTGYTNGQGQIKITVEPSPPLTIAIAANPPTIYSGGTTTIQAALTSGGNPITGATVTFTPENGGSFQAVTEKTGGIYTATYTAPDLTTQTQYSITVSASKSGFTDKNGQIQLTVKPLNLKINVKASDGGSLPDVALLSTSQPTGQSVLSATTSADGSASFNGLLKGSYTFKASKTGYEDKTWTITVSAGQETSEPITLNKPSDFPWALVIVALVIIGGVAFVFMRKKS
jgi:hypothetical protein